MPGESVVTTYYRDAEQCFQLFQCARLP